MLEQISSLNYLRTFAIAAQHLSFKAAAKVLNITPTAVSHQIKALEGQLRLRLFERHTRSISLTPAGAKLAQACTTHLNQLDHLVTELQQPKSDISISCCNSFAALWLTPRTTEISHRFPDNPLRINACDSLIDLTREQHIDIALRYGEDEVIDDETLLGTEMIRLYRHADYTVEPSAKPVLFVTEWPDNDLLSNIDWRAHVDSSKYIIKTFPQEFFVLQAVMTGQGYGLLSDVLATSAVEQGWITEDQAISPFTGYSYWLRTQAARKDLGAIQRFQHWLIEAFKAIGK